MVSYRLRPDAVLVEAQRTVDRTGAFIATVMLGASTATLGPQLQAGRLPAASFVGVLVVSLLNVLIVGWYLRRSAAAIWRSYELLVDADTIVRRQRNLPDLAVRRDQVRHLYERTGRGLFLVGAGSRVLVVPAGLDGYADVRALLTGWAGSCRLVPPRSLAGRPIWIGAAWLGLVATVFVATDLAIVGAAALLLVLGHLAALVWLLRVPDRPRAERRTTWALGVPLFLVAARILPLVAQAAGAAPTSGIALAAAGIPLVLFLGAAVALHRQLRRASTAGRPLPADHDGR